MLVALQPEGEPMAHSIKLGHASEPGTREYHPIPATTLKLYSKTKSPHIMLPQLASVRAAAGFSCLKSGV